MTTLLRLGVVNTPAEVDTTCPLHSAQPGGMYVCWLYRTMLPRGGLSMVLPPTTRPLLSTLTVLYVPGTKLSMIARLLCMVTLVLPSKLAAPLTSPVMPIITGLDSALA